MGFLASNDQVSGGKRRADGLNRLTARLDEELHQFGDSVPAHRIGKVGQPFDLYFARVGINLVGGMGNIGGLGSPVLQLLVDLFAVDRLGHKVDHAAVAPFI